jgi:hypothetical protein
MDLRSLWIRQSAGDDQRLQVFKDFYLQANREERHRLRNYIEAVAALSPSDLEESVQFAGSLGCTGDRVIAVQVVCTHLLQDVSATLDPHLLLEAIITWDQGAEFTPDRFGT